MTSKKDLQAQELTADLQRVRADFENYRKQADAQKAVLAKNVEIATIGKLLPVIDTVLIAIQHHPELEPVGKTVDKALGDLGVRQIEAEAGTVFDPDLHEAVKADEAEGETEVIAELLRPGYLLGEEVLRPAMVAVTRK
jgi:molecular chaperone GrpE